MFSMEQFVVSSRTRHVTESLTVHERLVKDWDVSKQLLSTKYSYWTENWTKLLAKRNSILYIASVVTHKKSTLAWKFTNLFGFPSRPSLTAKLMPSGCVFIGV